MPPYTPLILTKQWITPTKSEVTIQPLELYGEEYGNEDPMERISFGKLADMERRAKKPLLTPRNPSDLRKQKTERRSRHSSEDDSWERGSGRKSSRSRHRPSNLTVPDKKHRSISPRLEELSRASSRSSRRRNDDSYQSNQRKSGRRSSKSPAQNKRRQKTPVSGRSRQKYYYSDDFSDSSDDWIPPRRQYSRSPRRKQYYDDESREDENKLNKRKTKHRNSSNYSSPRPESNKKRKEHLKPKKSPKKKNVENDYVNFPISTGSETNTDFKAKNNTHRDEASRNYNLEVCHDDPWGPNSPRNRIQNMEASFNNSKTELTNSDKELEDEIYNEALKNKYEDAAETITIQETNTGDSNKTSDQNETDIHEEKMQYPNIVTDELLLQAYKDDEKDSCLGLSLGDLNSSRSSDPPPSDIIINIEGTHHEVPEYSEVKQWTFLPLQGEVPVLLGHVRDDQTGDVFNVFNDGPCDMVTSTQEVEEDLEKDEDISWCSVYFFVRIVGLALVGAALGSLIWVAQL